MTQRLTIRTSASTDLTTVDHTAIRDPDGPTERYSPYHHWQSVLYCADTDDVQAVVDRLASAGLADATWATVEYTHTLAEYDDATYRDDAAYYHAVHGLRTPPSIEWTDDYTVAVTAAWVLDGTEYSVDGATITIGPATDTYERTDRLVGRADGTVTVGGDGVRLGTVTVKEHIDRIVAGGIDAADYPDARDDATTVYATGTEPSERTVEERLHRIAQGVGADGEGKQGIAHRIDDLETRVENLESHH